MVKPARLRKGDTLAVLCPSWGGPSTFPHIFESGVENLRRLGFDVIEYPTTAMGAEELHRCPEKRAEDINRAFDDPRVRGIISAIGGNDSVRILPYLDPDVIKSHAKFFMGYSDFTAVSVFINQLGVVTFNGPSVMAGLSQLEGLPQSYRTYLEEFLFHPKPAVELPVFPHYANGYPDWADQGNTGRVHPWKTNEGPHCIQGQGVAGGELFGGCFEVLEMLKGTEYWPRPDFWEGKLLFLETSEEKPPVESVRSWLRSYGVMGVFDRVSGVLFGRARDYSAEEKSELERAIRTVISGEFGASGVPVMTNMDFGHTDPQVILPLGIRFAVDTDRKTVYQEESAFAEGESPSGSGHPR